MPSSIAVASAAAAAAAAVGYYWSHYYYIVASSPDASDASVSDADLATCIRVLNYFATPDGCITNDYREPRCKPLRVALQRYLEDARSRQFHGQGADNYTRQKEKKREKNAREQQARALDREAADKTRMRAERLRMLSELETAAASTGGLPQLILVPDGAVGDSAPEARLTLTGASAGTAEVGENGEVVALAGGADRADQGDGKLTELRTLQPCYACKTRFRQLHHFYAQLCPDCASLNYRKRLQHADLTDRVFLVTGGRVKVGFQIVLRLLRCGAHVLCTSRFPADCASRFAGLADSESWRGRLRCYGLDLRDLASLERFCAHLITRGQRLDGVINNAAQTIRRPAAYYSHLLPLEMEPGSWSSDVRALLADNDACFAAPAAKHATRALPPPELEASEADTATESACAAASSTAAATTGTAAATTAVAAPGCGPLSATAAATVPSALWSQAPLWSAQEHVAQPDEGTATNFPVGLVDVNGQQIDTRRSNSWLLRLQEVSTPEAAEVLAINTLAPFVLNARLRPVLEACPATERFVVNVSAMEGKFYRYKSPNHPHTNMAKAALNMMTRTCAEELASVGVYMNSVDTGWINDEKPLEKAAAHAEAHHFQTPLDEVDAAARVLAPILDTVNGEPPVHGKFLKDYFPVEW